MSGYKKDYTMSDDKVYNKFGKIVSMLDEECKEFATFIICKTLLSRNMTKAGAATFLKQNEQSLSKAATIIANLKKESNESVAQVIQDCALLQFSYMEQRGSPYPQTSYQYLYPLRRM